VLLSILPFLWGLSTALKTEQQAFSIPPRWIPSPIILDSFVNAIQGGMVRALLNSSLVTIATIVLTLGVATLASYSISRLSVRGKNLILLFLIAPQMLPRIINLVPLYIMMNQVGLMNSHVAMILIYCAESIPISVIILKGFFDSIPQSIEDSAIMDGCTRAQRLSLVMFPLAKPGLAAASVIIFMNAWNEFLAASAILTSKPLQTVPVVVWSFIKQYMVDWRGLMAAAWIAVIPVLVVFVFLQKRFVSGMAGGVGKL
jgi:ABC-type glycerol-3-phosphate transport system permease component